MAADLRPENDDGLVVLLPAAAGAPWAWWPVVGGVAGDERQYAPGDDRPWGDLPATRLTALVPAALAPVRIKPLPAMPVAQALAAERLGAAQASPDAHVAVAAEGDSMLTAAVARSDMDLWLAECAAAGFEPAALVPAALVLPAASQGVRVGSLAGEDLARSAQAAFAGEPSLVEALSGGQDVDEADADALLDRLALVHTEPPLNLRQGAYAPRRVAFYLLPDWAQLARMAATAALLALVFMAVWIVKWNMDSTAQEQAALAAAQARFPAATDLDSATRLVEGELARRGEGGAAFSAPAAAVLVALKGQPSVTLRDLGYAGDGTLRFTAAAPAPDAINQVLFALQNDGWKVTVPPSLAPDPTGATVAAITVRAP